MFLSVWVPFLLSEAIIPVYYLKPILPVVLIKHLTFDVLYENFKQ